MTQAQAKRKKKKKSKVNKLLVALLVVLIILLAAVFWVLYEVDKIPNHQINKEDIIINDIVSEQLGGYTNIALFGVDSRENELENNTRSDSIIIASINNKTKEVKLVSVYRDTFLDINNSYNKINSSYSKGGPELAISTLNKNLDLNITDFVTVNFSAVANVVNALGGVEIDIQEDEIEQVNAYTHDVNQILGTNSPELKKTGLQTLDGTQATAYSRVRYTTGNDYRRTERQRNVINAIVAKAKKSNIGTLYNVAQEMLPQIYTSLSAGEILNLAKDALSYSIAEDTGFPFEKKGTTINKASVVLPLDLTANVTQLHQFLFGDEEYTPSSTVTAISAKLKKYE